MAGANLLTPHPARPLVNGWAGFVVSGEHGNMVMILLHICFPPALHTLLLASIPHITKTRLISLVNIKKEINNQ